MIRNFSSFFLFFSLFSSAFLSNLFMLQVIRSVLERRVFISRLWGGFDSIPSFFSPFEIISRDFISIFAASSPRSSLCEPEFFYAFSRLDINLDVKILINLVIRVYRGKLSKLSRELISLIDRARVNN